MNKWQACPLFKWCPNKTATCRVYLPDDGCYWYRWFKELIQEDDIKESTEQMEPFL
jgi:hypothetical protein